jgi:GT2 family glycosyltransferase
MRPVGDFERVALLVLNFNGGRRLADMVLPGLGEVSDYGSLHDVYFIDNASSDESVTYVKSVYPWVNIEELTENKYLYAYNEVCTRLTHRIVYFLNNDIEVDRSLVSSVLPKFYDPDVFAVNTRVLQSDRVTPQGSRTTGGFHLGFWYYTQLDDIDETSSAYFALGGQAAFDRQKFLDVGGFDELFFPLYHEDIDLSLTAWRNGWKVLYEPSTAIIHEGGTSSNKKYTSFAKRRLIARQNFLLQWKHQTTLSEILLHFVFLLPRLLRELLKLNLAYCAGFVDAICRLTFVFRSRHELNELGLTSATRAFSSIAETIDGVDATQRRNYTK